MDTNPMRRELREVVTHPRLPYPAAILLLVTLLSACDGGIFGTGDGGGTVRPVPEPVGGGGGSEPTDDDGATDGAGSESTDDDGATDGAGSDDGGSETPGDSMVTGEGMLPPATELPPQIGAMTISPLEGDGVPLVGFTNLLAGDSDTLPAVRLVNTSSEPLRLDWDDGSVLRPVADVAGNSVTNAVAIPLSASAMTLIEPGDDANTRDTKLVRIEPLVLAAGSVSLLIAREYSNMQAWEVIALASRQQSDDPEQALIRIVPVSVLGDTAREASRFSLTPAGTTPGTAIVRFPEVRISTPSEDYFSVPAGDYQLSGADGHLAARPLTVAAGTVYTLIVTGQDSVTVVIENDLSRR